MLLSEQFNVLATATFRWSPLKLFADGDFIDHCICISADPVALRLFVYELFFGDPDAARQCVGLGGDICGAFLALKAFSLCLRQP